MEQPNETLERAKIIGHFGYDLDSYDFRRMDTALYRLRQKVSAADPQNELPIKTLSRQGYIWTE